MRENVETKPGYYLVRDQRWSRFTICRQFKAGSTGVDRRGRAKVAAGTELPFSFERFWLTVEMLWKLSLLLLPLAVSDEDHALKFVPGAVSTAIMLLCQLSFNPYISTRQNREPPRYRWHLGCILLKMPAIIVAGRCSSRTVASSWPSG